LGNLSGAEFDKKYVALMVEAHENDVEAFQDVAYDSEEADLKSFATKNIPTIKSYDKKIKGISDKME